MTRHGLLEETNKSWESKKPQRVMCIAILGNTGHVATVALNTRRLGLENELPVTGGEVEWVLS